MSFKNVYHYLVNGVNDICLRTMTLSQLGQSLKPYMEVNWLWSVLSNGYIMK